MPKGTFYAASSLSDDKHLKLKELFQNSLFYATEFHYFKEKCLILAGIPTSLGASKSPFGPSNAFLKSLVLSHFLCCLCICMV